MLLAQLLPPAPRLDPEVALKIAQAGQEMLRKDFYSAAFVIMGAALVFVVLWVVWLQVRLSNMQERLGDRLSLVQDQRVQDHVAGEARANATAERMATHMDKSTEVMGFLVQLRLAAPPPEKK